MAKVIEIDATTNTTTERNETVAEKSARENEHKIYLDEIQAAEAKQVARTAVLDRLGLTEQEAQLLLGA